MARRARLGVLISGGGVNVMGAAVVTGATFIAVGATVGVVVSVADVPEHLYPNFGHVPLLKYRLRTTIAEIATSMSRRAYTSILQLQI